MNLLFKSLYGLFVAAVVAVGLLLLSTLVPIPGNFKVKVVKSGSMEPAIRTGGIVVIKLAPSYALGDVITFGADTKTQIPTTHRIVEVLGEGSMQAFKTKGDANDAPDPGTTHLGDVRGKMIFTVPYMGYILDFARKPVGFGLLVGVPALAIIFDEVLKIFREVKLLRRKKSGSDDTHATPSQQKTNSI